MYSTSFLFFLLLFHSQSHSPVIMSSAFLRVDAAKTIVFVSDDKTGSPYNCNFDNNVNTPCKLPKANQFLADLQTLDSAKYIIGYRNCVHVCVSNISTTTKFFMNSSCCQIFTDATRRKWIIDFSSFFLFFLFKTNK